MRNPTRRAVRLTGALGMLFAAGAAISCGSDGDAGASCENFMACGGAVAGTWQAQQTCPPPARPLLPNCTGSQIDFTGVKALGDVNFAADMKYTQNLSFSGTAKITLPLSCLGQAAALLGGKCEGLPLLLTVAQSQSMLDLNIPGTVTCTGMDVCNCTLTLVPTKAKNTSSGSYAITADKLVLSDAAAQTSSFDYCAKGNSLVVKPSAGSTTQEPTDFTDVGLSFTKK